MNNTNSRMMRAFAVCATLASIAAPLVGVSATATAATTSPTIEVHAAQGQKITGKLDFYLLGTYADIQKDTAGTKVSSVNVVANTDKQATAAQRNAWAQQAIIDQNNSLIDATKTTADNGDTISIPWGEDAVGAIANLNENGYNLNGTTVDKAKAARQLASIRNKLIQAQDANKKRYIGNDIKAAATVNPSDKSSVTVTLPSEGLYLIVDSNGLGVIIGTKINGMDMTKQTLGTALLKEGNGNPPSKQVKSNANTSWASGTTQTYGQDIDVKVTDSIPNGEHTGGLQKLKYTDTPQGMKVKNGSVTVYVVDNGKKTDVTKKVTIAYTGTIKGDGTIMDWQGVRTDPDITAPANGYALDASSLIKDYAGKQLEVDYKATMLKHTTSVTTKTQDPATNTVMEYTTWQDIGGSSHHTEKPSPAAKVWNHDLTLKKTSLRDTTMKVSGAKFQVYRQLDGTDTSHAGWLVRAADGSYTFTNDQSKATKFVSGDTNWDGTVDGKDDGTKKDQAIIPALGDGTYRITESDAPAGFRNETMSKPKVQAVIKTDLNTGTASITYSPYDNWLPNLVKDNGDQTATIKDIDSLTQLPQTGGAWTVGAYMALAVGFAGLAFGTVGRARRHQREADNA